MKMTCPVQKALQSNNIAKYVLTSIALINILLALVTIVGNVICIITLIKTRSLHVPSNVFVGALCFSDLFAGLIVQPLFIAVLFLVQTSHDIETLHKYYAALFIFTTTASFLYTYLVTLDRYFAICHPFRYVATVTCKKYIYLTLSTIILVILLQLVVKYKNRIVILGTVTFQLVAIGHVILSYALIYRAIRAQRRVGITVGCIGDNTLSALERKNNARRNEDTKKAYTIGIIIIAFACCYAPQIGILAVPVVIEKEVCYHPVNVFLVEVIVTFIMLINSAINPIIYSLRMKAIREAASQIFCRRCLAEFASPDNGVNITVQSVDVREGHT